MQEMLIGILILLIQSALAMVFSVWTLYSTMKVLDRMTAGIEEWEEIKKGNIAVGLFYAVVLLSTMILVWPRISDLTQSINFFAPLNRLVITVGFSLLNYFVSVILSISLFYISINLIDRLTASMHDMEQLKKGNVAVALLMSVMLIGMVFLIRFPFEHIFDIIKAMELSVA